MDLRLRNVAPGARKRDSAARSQAVSPAAGKIDSSALRNPGRFVAIPAVFTATHLQKSRRVLGAELGGDLRRINGNWRHVLAARLQQAFRRIEDAPGEPFTLPHSDAGERENGARSALFDKPAAGPLTRRAKQDSQTAL